MILSLNYQVLLNEVCKQMNESDCTNSNVSAHTSYIITFISLTLSFPPLLLSGIYSSIADKYGRKVVIIMPIVGIFVKILTLLYVIFYIQHIFFLCIYSVHLLMVYWVHKLISIWEYLLIPRIQRV